MFFTPDILPGLSIHCQKRDRITGVYLASGDGGSISDASHAGDVFITGTGTNTFSVQGVGALSDNADIIAENLTVNSVSRFGAQASPIGLRVNKSLSSIGNVHGIIVQIIPCTFRISHITGTQ